MRGTSFSSAACSSGPDVNYIGDSFSRPQVISGLCSFCPKGQCIVSIGTNRDLIMEKIENHITNFIVAEATNIHWLLGKNILSCQ